MLCFCKHLKSIFCNLPELVIFQPLDAEPFNRQRMEKFPVSPSVLKPKDILVPSQKPHRSGEWKLPSLWRFQRQPVRKAIPDQRLRIIIKAGKVHHSVFHLNDIHIVKQKHPVLWVGFHSKSQGLTGSIEIDHLCPEYLFQIGA